MQAFEVADHLRVTHEGILQTHEAQRRKRFPKEVQQGMMKTDTLLAPFLLVLATHSPISHDTHRGYAYALLL